MYIYIYIYCIDAWIFRESQIQRRGTCQHIHNAFKKQWRGSYTRGGRHSKVPDDLV